MQATKVGHRLENDVLVVISLQAQPFRKSKMVEGEGGGRVIGLAGASGLAGLKSKDCVLCVQLMLIKVSSPLNKFVYIKIVAAVYCTRWSSNSSACKWVCVMCACVLCRRREGEEGDGVV